MIRVPVLSVLMLFTLTGCGVETQAEEAEWEAQSRAEVPCLTALEMKECREACHMIDGVGCMGVCSAHDHCDGSPLDSL